MLTQAKQEHNHKDPATAKIRWQCRRGMLELDQILQTFFEKYYKTLPTKQQLAFVKLLEATDQQLYYWLIRDQIPEDSSLQDVVLLIRYFSGIH